MLRSFTLTSLGLLAAFSPSACSSGGSSGTGSGAAPGTGAGAGVGGVTGMGGGNTGGMGATGIGGASGGASGGAAGQGGQPPACSGLPTAFAASPQAYGIPAPRCNTRFDAPGQAAGIDYALLDRIGDARRDLVVYRDDCDATVGQQRWDVYEAGPQSFAAAPMAWALPPPRCNVRFDALAQSTGSLHYLLWDTTGDGATDLVVTHDNCEPNIIGNTRWDVYPAGPQGFATTPTPYSLPAPRCGVEFDAASALNGSLQYFMLDISGDGFADLVVTKDSCDAAIGDFRWDVYLGSPTGLAASPMPYTLPAPRCGRNFDAQVGTGSLGFAVLSLTGDPFLELVVYKDACDATIGQQRWDVYAGSATGFAAQPAAFTIPAPRCGQAFDAPVQQASTLSYVLSDFSCDNIPELVVTRDDCAAAGGQARWELYAGSPQGFASTPAPLFLPAPRCGDSFVGMSNGALSFTLTTLTALDRPQLAVHRDDCDPAVGQQRWELYPLQ